MIIRISRGQAALKAMTGTVNIVQLVRAEYSKLFAIAAAKEAAMQAEVDGLRANPLDSEF
jgi:hypothetical protein